MRSRLTLPVFLPVLLPLAASLSMAPARAADTMLVDVRATAAASPRAASDDLQVAPNPGKPSPAPTGGLSADVGPPDESALRYYASTNQRARVNIEIVRLKRLYPSWDPPQNLYDAAAPGGEDEGDLWDLFSADRIDELKAAIERRVREEPGWQPSNDLVQKVARKSLRLRILGLYKEGKTKDILDLVKAEGYGGDDADIEVMWTIAEVYARSKQPLEAQALYKSILTSSGDPAQRLATVQKAMSTLRMGDVEPLIALGRAGADGRSEFSAILVDIVRARISAYLHDERANEIDPAELQAFEDYARQAKEPNEPALVAWYFYKLKDYRSAFEWFKSALAHGGDAMIAHGLAHSLRELGMKRETEEVAFAWREPLVNNVIVYLDILETDLTKEVPPAIEPDRLLRYARTTMETASGEGAQALAWYAYNSCQYDVAWEWFQRAVAWYPKEATVYGYALTAGKLKKRKELFELANRYDGLFPKVVEIIFPDGYYHPPTPCDRADAQRMRPRAQPMGAFTVPGPASTDPAAARAGADPRDAAMQYGMNAQQAAQQQLPKVSRADFPVAIDPENGLRAAAIARPGERAMPVPAQGLAGIGLQAEPLPGPYPLVARRVPGVGPMPYERWGFGLLPGWNGAQTATWPPASAQIAPAGTLWAAEAKRADGGVPAAQPMPGVRQTLPGANGAMLAPPRPAPAWAGPRSEATPVESKSRAFIRTAVLTLPGART